ncbi:TPA: helix-turn-helix transcriptional regulator [Escherichia coli]|nr:helix-turn-helix transcriptional regulator [Escherichia coli]
MTTHVLFTEEIVAYIERNIRRNIRLTEVGERSGYSVRQLQRIFQRVVGMPVTVYIRLRRLTLAAVMLRITRRTVTETARILGFSSHRTFTRLFSRSFGMAPDDYRQLQGWGVGRLLPRWKYRGTGG